MEMWPPEPPDVPQVVVDDLVIDAASDRLVRRPLPPEEVGDLTGLSKRRRISLSRSYARWVVDLPEDFCLRECMLVDPDDHLSVAEFVLRWGRLTPYESEVQSPTASMPGAVFWHTGLLMDRKLDRQLGAIRPEDIWRHGFPLVLESQYLRYLRAAVKHFLASLRGEPLHPIWHSEGISCAPADEYAWAIFEGTVNAALRPFTVRIRTGRAVIEPTHNRASTYEAAALQLAKIATEGRQVRTCANERCTKQFTRQRGRAKYANSGHSSGVLYCSHQCAKAQSERVRRARRKAEADANGGRSRA